MELSPSREADNCAANHEFPNNIWNPMIHYRIHKSPPLIRILSQVNPIHNISIYLTKINFNIVHIHTSSSSQWPLSFWLSHQCPICIPLLPHWCYMPCSSNPSWLHHSNYTWRIVQVVKLLIMQFSPTSCHFIPLRSKYSQRNIMKGKCRKDSCIESINMRTEVSILNVSEITNIMPEKQFHFNVNTFVTLKSLQRKHD
jgi:hypothetical protein